MYYVWFCYARAGSMDEEETYPESRLQHTGFRCLLFYCDFSLCFFEIFIINYRPVLINGVLEASYPSSTTILVMTVMPTAIIQFNRRIKNKVLRRFVAVVISVFIILMVLGRLVSGVHWISDIVGACLLSYSLYSLYRAAVEYSDKKE